MTRHSILALVGMMLALWAFTRACNPPHPAESEPGTVLPSATWAPAWPEPLGGRAWLPVAGATIRDGRTVGAWGVWSWVDVAVARADASKPTAAPTASATRTPTATHPPRPTRPARATGTPTQGRMATVPACGCNTPEPGPGTRFPGCWPYGGTCAPTETPTASDTPPATATWEPTPTRPVIEGPAPRVVPLPDVWVYRFPMLLVWRRR